MTNERTTIHLSIMGETIALKSSQANVQNLQLAAKVVNEKINDFQRLQSSIPNHKLPLMVALELCFEGLQKKQMIEDMESQCSQLQQQLEELFNPSLLNTNSEDESIVSKQPSVAENPFPAQQPPALHEHVEEKDKMNNQTQSDAITEKVPKQQSFQFSPAQSTILLSKL